MCLPNDLAIATFAKTATNGTTIMLEPRFPIISVNGTVVLFALSIVKEGTLNVGKPDCMAPKSKKKMSY